MSNILENIYPRLHFGPMSKNIVDAVISVATETQNSYGLIASRRQVDYDGGYVNNWKTGTLCHYIHSKTDYVFFCRDHGGPGQGGSESRNTMKEAKRSLREDSRYTDIIHIDPWKMVNETSFHKGIEMTIDLLKYCYKISNNASFEIGTEEAIHKYEPSQLAELLRTLKNRCSPDLFYNIKYACIQSGVGLDIVNRKNNGTYNQSRFDEFIKVCKEYNVMSKEHNGDFLHINDVEDRFDGGLSALNIAPELATIESMAIWDMLKYAGEYENMQKIWQLCFDHAPWQKWVDPEYAPMEEDKEKFAHAFSHYIYNHAEFRKILMRCNLDNSEIINTLKQHIYKLDEIAYGKNINF